MLEGDFLYNECWVEVASEMLALFTEASVCSSSQSLNVDKKALMLHKTSAIDLLLNFCLMQQTSAIFVEL